MKMQVQENLCLISFLPYHGNDSNDDLVFSYSRMPHLFTKDIALVQQLFEALCKVGKYLGSLDAHLETQQGGKHFLLSFTGRAWDSTCYSRSIIYDGWSLQYFGRSTENSHGGTCGFVLNKGRVNSELQWLVVYAFYIFKNKIWIAFLLNYLDN